LIVNGGRAFSSEKVAVFLKILLIPLRNVEFQDEQFGSFGKKSNFSVWEKTEKGSNSVPD
jgi:hypothetical protein